MGMGQQLTEDALGNHDLVAEKYIGAGIKGGLLNMLLSGGLHAGGGALVDKVAGVGLGVESIARGGRGYVSGIGERAAGAVQREGDTVAAQMRRISGKDIDAMAERQFGHVPDGLGEKVRQHYVKGAAGLSGKDASTIDRLTAFTPEGKEARRIAVFDSEKELEAATREFRSSGDGMLRSNKLTMEEFQGELKMEKIAASVKRGNEAEVAAYVRGQIAKVIDTRPGSLRKASRAWRVSPAPRTTQTQTSPQPSRRAAHPTMPHSWR